MNTKELLGYFLILLMVLIGTTITALFNDKPNFSDPFNPNLPAVTPPEATGSPPTAKGIQIPENLFSAIIYLMLGIAIVIFLYLLVTGLRSTYFNLGKRGRHDKVEIKRRRLEDARIAAYKIIDEGLATGQYTHAFIEAYIALDEGLENFREIMRPKHVTPKEYAFSVALPVFQAGVFRTVSAYYDIRYGSQDATKGDLHGFREQLDYLFIDDVPEIIQKEWSLEFDRLTSTDYNFKIPRYTDHTRPGGN